MNKAVKKLKDKVQRFFSITPHLKYIYAFHVKHSKIVENAVLLESFHGKTINDSSLVMAREILRSYPGQYKLYYATRDMKAHSKFIKAEGLDVELVDTTTAKYMKVLATSKYIIANASLPMVFIRRKEQVYLQTWHGTPLKTLGRKMRFGIESMYNVQHNFLQASYILQPNEFTKDAIMGDYFLEDLYTGKVIMSGYPRNQILMQPDKAEALRSRLGLDGKTVYAYMPTWRGTSNHTIETDEYFHEIRKIFDKLDQEMAHDQVMYVNFHPILQGSFDFKKYKHIKPFPKGVDNYSFLSCADCLVTDYSSVLFDFSLTKKPVVLFMYDYDQYIHDRNLYMDIKTLPFRQIYETDEFVKCISGGEALNDSYEDTEYFSSFFRYDSPDNPEKILRLLFKGDESGLTVIDYSHNRDKEWTLYRPEKLDTESDLRTLQEICDEDKNALVLLDTGLFENDKLSPIIYDRYNRIRYIIAIDKPPRTYLAQIRMKLGDKSAEEEVHQDDLKRCLPDVSIKEEITDDYGVFCDGCRVKPSDIVLTDFTLGNYGPASLDISIKDTKGLAIKEVAVLDDKNRIIRRWIPNASEIDSLSFRFDFREDLEKEAFPNKGYASVGLICEDAGGDLKLLKFTDGSRLISFDPHRKIKRRLTYDPLRYRCSISTDFMKGSPEFTEYRPKENARKKEQEVCMVPTLMNDRSLSFRICGDDRIIESAGDTADLEYVKCGKNRIEIKAVLRGWKRDEVKAMVLKYSSSAEELVIPMESEITEGAGGVVIRASLDVGGDLPLRQLHWDPLVVMRYDGRDYYLRVTTESGIKAQKLYFTSTQAECGNGCIIFPYFTKAGTLKFTYRPKSKYDTTFVRIKEITALIICFFAGPFLRRRKNIIVTERLCETAQDNSFYFFRYYMEHLKGKKKSRIFYAIDKSSDDYKRLKKYDANVIDFMSLKYMVYAMTMKAVVSTDSKSHMYTWHTRPSKVMDKIRMADELFFQPGATSLRKVDRIFGRHVAKPMKWFAASSAAERDMIIKGFDYDKKSVPVTGFPRWDALKDRRDPSDRFVLMVPAWRMWLEDATEEQFTESEYFHRYMDLIAQSGLVDVLKDNGIRLVIYLHPMLAEHIMKLKDVPENVVECVPSDSGTLDDLVMRAEMLVTDYSTVWRDMMFLDKPVVFYQFDRKKYLEEHGHYIDLESKLPLDKAEDGSEAARYVKEYIENGFVIRPEHQDCMKKIFKNKDRKNCKRAFDSLDDVLSGS
ncbi:MAG: CDP-glycerol glycerophosphotransferase family protein [Eubacterium sp.]|nr:CDP-glycerol glycerophosphotransferase family protein [Eubacterium sp.]